MFFIIEIAYFDIEEIGSTRPPLFNESHPLRNMRICTISSKRTLNLSRNRPLI